MSQLITLRRMLTVAELEDVLRNYADLQVVELHTWGCRVSYVPEPDTHIVLVNGELQATSPSTSLYDRLEMLAKDLSGILVDEEEEAIADTDVQEDNVSSFSIFWPAVFAVLLILLVWRW